MNSQLTERNVRTTARKAGLKLESGHGRVANGYALETAYWLIDPDIDLVVFRGNSNSCGRSLEQCAAYLQLPPTERWLRFQESVEAATPSHSAK